MKKDYSYANVAADALRKLKNAQKRREEKYKHLRRAYAYYISDLKEYTDNLILLPFANKEGHQAYLKSIVSHLLESLKKDPDEWRINHYKNLEIHYIGDFEKDTMIFDKLKTPRCVVKCSEFLRNENLIINDEKDKNK